MDNIKKIMTGAAVLGSLLLGGAALASGGDDQRHFETTKIADTNTNVPAAGGQFGGFNPPPSLSDGEVAFQAFSATLQEGIYLFSDGTLSKVADTNTKIPGGTGDFAGFSPPPSLSEGDIAFKGFSTIGPNGILEGIYLFSDEALRRVADSTTPVPGGVGKFSHFGNPSLSRGSVAFEGRDAVSKDGIYLASNHSLRTVANSATPVPGGVGTFKLFGDPVLSGRNVAFQGFSATFQEGIYLASHGSLSKIADSNTVIPGGTGKFIVVGAPSISGRSVAFEGVDALGQEGLYLSSDGSLVKVADSSTPIPGGSGSFSGFGGPSLSGHRIAFDGLDSSGNDAIYVFSDRSLTRVVGSGDSLDGKTVQNASAPSLDGDQLAVVITFTDGSQGLFKVTLGDGHGDGRN